MVTGLFVDGRFCDMTSPEGRRLVAARMPMPPVVKVREQNLAAIGVVAPYALALAAVYFLGVGVASLLAGDLGVGVAAFGPSAASLISAAWMWRTAHYSAA